MTKKTSKTPPSARTPSQPKASGAKKSPRVAKSPEIAKKVPAKKVTTKKNRLKWFLLGFLTLVVAVLAAIYASNRNEIHRYIFERRGIVPGIKVEETPIPDALRWHQLRKDLEQWRLTYADRHRKARTTDAKKAVLADARKLLEFNLPELMRCWIGTPWDFNGTAKEPGGGKIACGYFVSTVLEGAGFRVQRVSLAQQPSQNILRTFVPQGEMQIRAGVPYKTYRAEITRNRPGIYIVGLDTHVGFVVVPENNGADFRFLHSSGSKPWYVVEENADQAHVLANSRYRVIGNLTANDALIRSWLNGEKFPTHR